MTKEGAEPNPGSQELMIASAAIGRLPVSQPFHSSTIS